MPTEIASQAASSAAEFDWKTFGPALIAVGGVLMTQALVAVGWFVAWKSMLESKDRDHLNTYRKQILDMRMEACKAVDIALQPLLLEGVDPKDKRYSHTCLYEGPNRFLGVWKDIRHANEIGKIWLSPITTRRVQAVVDYFEMLCIEKHLAHIQAAKDECMEIAKECHADLKRLVKDARSALRGEYATLGDVTGFLEQAQLLSPEVIEERRQKRAQSEGADRHQTNPDAPK